MLDWVFALHTHGWAVEGGFGKSNRTVFQQVSDIEPRFRVHSPTVPQQRSPPAKQCEIAFIYIIGNIAAVSIFLNRYYKTLFIHNYHIGSESDLLF